MPAPACSPHSGLRKYSPEKTKAWFNRRGIWVTHLAIDSPSPPPSHTPSRLSPWDRG